MWPNFLSQSDLHEIFNDIENRFTNGDMLEAAVKGEIVPVIEQPGRLGLFENQDIETRMVTKRIRNTATCWLDLQEPKSLIEEQLLQYLHVFRKQLGNQLSLNFDLEDTEVLYARYPQGGFYKKHSDSRIPGSGVKPRDSERRISFILYLNNRCWQHSDGGRK